MADESRIDKVLDALREWLDDQRETMSKEEYGDFLDQAITELEDRHQAVQEEIADGEPMPEVRS